MASAKAACCVTHDCHCSINEAPDHPAPILPFSSSGHEGTFVAIALVETLTFEHAERISNQANTSWIWSRAIPPPLPLYRRHCSLLI